MEVVYMGKCLACLREWNFGKEPTCVCHSWSFFNCKICKKIGGMWNPFNWVLHFFNWY